MDIKNKAIAMGKRNELIALIRKLGSLVNEDKSFIEAYAQEQASAWAHDLDRAIKCFKQLIWKEENKL